MMPEISTVVLATFAAQTLGAAVIAILLFGFLRQYGKAYLAHWTKSWVALAVYHFAAAVGIILAVWRHTPATSPIRIATALTSGLAGYLQIGWLLFGAYELLRRRPVRIRMSHYVLAALAVIGVVTAFVFITPSWSPASRHFMRVGV